MLNYKPVGPDGNGDYAITYATPGVPNSTTVAGLCRSLTTAQEECDRLNEQQVEPKRAALRERANRMVIDLPRGSW
jgi:hypothetical protein